MSASEEKLNKRRLKSSYFTSVISIALVLFMVGLVALLVFNAKRLSDYVKENIGFSLVINEQVAESEILRLKKIIDVQPFVKSTEYVSKEVAAARLMADLGQDFVAFLGYNPLLASIEVKMVAASANPDSIAVIEKQLLRNPEIKEIIYEQNIVQLVNDNIRKISIFIMAVGLVLFLISIALINNVIRLSIYSKRFVIHTMQLVGATRSFIRRPFLSKSTLTGLLSALVAMMFLVGCLYFGQRQMPELSVLADLEVLGIVFALIVLLGVVISFISTYMAVTSYLKSKEDDLY